MEETMTIFEFIIFMIQYNFYLMIGVLVSALIYTPIVFTLFGLLNLTSKLVIKVKEKIKGR